VRDSPQLDRNKTGGSETEIVLIITAVTIAETQRVKKHTHNITIMAHWLPFV
jgi:quercetin dioxygenase-like cupin family protein